MFDYSKEIKAELDTILPTYYETFANDKTPTPCFTYMPLSNVANIDADLSRYSTLSYTVKVWGRSKDDYATAKQKAIELDDKMLELGFHRIASQELWVGFSFQIVFTYSAFGCELK